MAVRHAALNRGGRERGVALVTALLVVAIAATLASDMVADQQIAIRRTQNLLAADQAGVYALAAETFARDLLERDDPDVDHPGDDWAQRLPVVPFQGAQIVLRIEDLQGRLNLNELDQEEEEARQREAARLGRLLARVYPEYQSGVEQAVIDWIDEDLELTFPDGAEDDFYTRLEPPYRPANRPMLGPSELRLVKGVDRQTYEAVRDFVAALPAGTPVNVNTAPMGVLASLAEPVDEAAARAAVEGRPDDGYPDVQAFLDANPAFALPELDPSRLSVSSRFFLVRAEVRLDRATAVQYSLVERPQEGAPRVVYRGRARP